VIAARSASVFTTSRTRFEEELKLILTDARSLLGSHPRGASCASRRVYVRVYPNTLCASDLVILWLVGVYPAAGLPSRLWNRAFHRVPSYRLSGILSA
jgi:hypothetical protein